jgi:hypothetical protein
VEAWSATNAPSGTTAAGSTGADDNDDQHDQHDQLDQHVGGSVTDASRGWSGSRSAVRPGGAGAVARPEPATLVDVLERVLDKGIVIAGDIKVSLLDIELLTIKIRLLIASVDRAREMGIDWWEHDPELSGGGRRLAEENRQLRSRVEELESRGSGDGERGGAADETDSDDSDESDDEDPDGG